MLNPLVGAQKPEVGDAVLWVREGDLKQRWLLLIHLGGGPEV